MNFNFIKFKRLLKNFQIDYKFFAELFEKFFNIFN